MYDETASFSHLVGDLQLDEIQHQTPPASELNLRLSQGRSPDKGMQRHVSFHGVLAYDFKHAGDVTIVFDIAVVTMESVVAAHPEWEKSAAHFRWPVAVEKGGRLLDALHASSADAFEIQSSCGLFGIILAASMVIDEVAQDGNARTVASWPQ